jgi:16S rRNA processing protein RimM
MILLGRITGAHGIRGEVVVHSFAAVPEDIAAYGPLSDKTGERSFVLKVVRMTPKGAVIARIAGIDDRNAAEALKGTELFVDRKKLPPPGEGEFYHTDLIGLAAVSQDGAPLGEVVGVHNFGAGDLIEIRLAAGGETELVTFTDAFVPTVDIPGRRVVVILPAAAPGEDGDT